VSVDHTKTCIRQSLGIRSIHCSAIGICNESATFERPRCQALLGFQGDCCLVYIDDILIFSKIFIDALVNATFMSYRLAGANLQLMALSLLQTWCQSVAINNL
jgi:hypothetical protein